MMYSNEKIDKRSLLIVYLDYRQFNAVQRFEDWKQTHLY